MYKLNGYDDCIIGIVAEAGIELRLVYSIDKFVRRLQLDHSITYDTAYAMFRDIIEGDEDFELPVFMESADIMSVSAGETRLQLDALALEEKEMH